MPALLAFDTATGLMSVGLQVGESRWVHEAEGGALASTRLLPAIFELLERAGTSLGQLDAIGFGRGPGAFTGLRTACSVAQGLAFGAGLPVLAIDSLMAVAEDACADRPVDRCWVAMDARMNEIYAACYARDVQGWRVVTPPSLDTPEALQASWRQSPLTARDVIAGHALDAFPGLDTGLATTAPQALPRAGALLTLAAAHWSRGEAVDAGLALPLYVRDKVAQTTLEREAAQARKAAEAAA